MGEPVKRNTVTKQKILRCMDWLQKQNNQEPTKLSLQNKNDIQFIIQTNAARKNFLLAAAEDEATVPAAVDENPIVPKAVVSVITMLGHLINILGGILQFTYNEIHVMNIENL